MTSQTKAGHILGSTEPRSVGDRPARMEGARKSDVVPAGGGPAPVLVRAWGRLMRARQR
jgi:hypothetical protein